MKPLQLGAQLAFGVIQNVQKAVQGLTGGDHQEVPPQPAPRRPAKPKPLDDATIRTQQKTRRKKSTAAARKRAPKRTTSERKTSAASKAEPGSSSSGNGDGKSS